MNSSYAIEVNELYVLVRISDTVTLDLILAVIKDLFQLEEYQNRGDIWDFRDLSGELDFSKIRTIRNHLVVNYNLEWQHHKTAIVINSSVGMGFARMYQTLADDPQLNFEVQIFKTMADAEEWVAKR